MKKFPFYKQPDFKDCGPTCLKIIAKHYGKTLNIQTLRQLSETTREGSNLLSLSDAAEKIGLRTLGVKISLEKLQEAPLPCILHWNNNHYVVLYEIKGKRKWGVGGRKREEKSGKTEALLPTSHVPLPENTTFLILLMD